MTGVGWWGLGCADPPALITTDQHSLSCAKYKILRKDPDSRNLAKTDKFVYNEAFTDR